MSENQKITGSQPSLGKLEKIECDAKTIKMINLKTSRSSNHQQCFNYIFLLSSKNDVSTNVYFRLWQFYLNFEAGIIQCSASPAPAARPAPSRPSVVAVGVTPQAPAAPFQSTSKTEAKTGGTVKEGIGFRWRPCLGDRVRSSADQGHDQQEHRRDQGSFHADSLKDTRKNNSFRFLSPLVVPLREALPERILQ